MTSRYSWRKRKVELFSDAVDQATHSEAQQAEGTMDQPVLGQEPATKTVDLRRPGERFYIGNLPKVGPIISAHDYHSVWPVDKLVEYRHLLRQALDAANPALGYWQNQTILVLVNLSREDARCDLGASQTVDVHTTSSTASLAQSEQNASRVTLPARSLATVVISRSR